MFVANESTQGDLFIETARLSEGFFEQLQKHPVPIEEAAVKQIANNSMALDVYVWLSYRLHALKELRPVTWKTLHAQFGAASREWTTLSSSEIRSDLLWQSIPRRTSSWMARPVSSSSPPGHPSPPTLLDPVQLSVVFRDDPVKSSHPVTPSLSYSAR